MAGLTRGDFSERVEFRNATKTGDDSGGRSEAYTTLLKTWASVKSKSGQRSWEAGSDTPVDKKTICVYWREALNAVNKDTRIVYDGKSYGIDNSHFIDEVKKIIQYEVSGS